MQYGPRRAEALSAQINAGRTVRCGDGSRGRLYGLFTGLAGTGYQMLRMADRRGLPSLLASCCAFRGTAQKIECTLAYSIDSTRLTDPDAMKAFRLWRDYLAADPDSLYDNPRWSEADKARYRSYDLLRSEGFLTPGLYAFGLKNQVISIYPLGEDRVVRSVFYWDGAPPYIMAIINVVAEPDGRGGFRLTNWLSRHTAAWPRITAGPIEYRYYPSYPFNPYEAERAARLVAFFNDKFDAGIDKVEHYIAESCDGIMRLKGFDYVVEMGMNYAGQCGFCDTDNGIIYSNARRGECCGYELTRLINNRYPRAHGLLLNGLADYFIGDNVKTGLPLEKHFARMDEYLSAHPEVDLADLPSFYRLDDITTLSYFLGLAICRTALEKGACRCSGKDWSTELRTTTCTACSTGSSGFRAENSTGRCGACPAVCARMVRQNTNRVKAGPRRCGPDGSGRTDSVKNRRAVRDGSRR